MVSAAWLPSLALCCAAHSFLGNHGPASRGHRLDEMNDGWRRQVSKLHLCGLLTVVENYSARQVFAF